MTTERWARGRALGVVLDSALDLVRRYDDAGDLHRDLAGAQQATRQLTYSRAWNVRGGRDVESARVIARYLDRVINPARERANRAGSSLLDREFARAVESAWAFTRELQDVLEGGAAQSGPQTAGLTGLRPMRSARRITASAVWVLRSRDRCRYREEWLAELNDLAAAGAVRRNQFGYALRLLARAGSLRRALAVPHPSKELAK